MCRPDAEGHIAAHCQPDLLQRLPRQIRGVQGPQAPQHRRHIRTAAPKPRISRDPLGKAYLQPRHRAAQLWKKASAARCSKVTFPAGREMPSVSKEKPPAASATVTVSPRDTACITIRMS